jgi:predicted DNA repair protein MutK
MKMLSNVGTIPMFLVGGGILAHSFQLLSVQITILVEILSSFIWSFSTIILHVYYDCLLGIAAGGLVLVLVTFMDTVISKLRS